MHYRLLADGPRRRAQTTGMMKVGVSLPEKLTN
jgi:hypothetical protein